MKSVSIEALFLWRYLKLFPLSAVSFFALVIPSAVEGLLEAKKGCRFHQG